MVNSIIKEPISFLYKIIFYYDLFNNWKMHSYSEINKYRKSDVKYIKSFETFVNHFVDTMKEYILRDVINIRKIKIVVESFNENNKIHLFYINFINKIFDEKKYDKKNINFGKSIFINAYDENNKILYVGTILV